MKGAFSGVLYSLFSINLCIADIAAELKSGSKSQQDLGSSGRARKIKPFKLSAACLPLGRKKTSEMIHMSFKRILQSDSKSNLYPLCSIVLCPMWGDGKLKFFALMKVLLVAFSLKSRKI